MLWIETISNLVITVCEEYLRTTFPGGETISAQQWEHIDTVEIASRIENETAKIKIY